MKAPFYYTRPTGARPIITQLEEQQRNENGDKNSYTDKTRSDNAQCASRSPLKMGNWKDIRAKGPRRQYG